MYKLDPSFESQQQACLPCSSANFDYHSAISIDTSHDNWFDQTVYPTHGLTSDPYTMDFEPMGDSFLSMKNMILEITFNITKDDGSDLGEELVGFANNALMSMFERIDTELNETQINAESSYAIPFQSYIETILSFSDIESTGVSSSGFIKDEATRFNVFTKEGGVANRGFVERAALCAKSRDVRVCGPIFNNFLRSDCHLAPGNKLSLTFHKSRADFFICTDEDGPFIFNIKDMKIHTRRLYLLSGIPRQLINPNKPQRYLSTFTMVQEFQTKDVRHFRASLFKDTVLPKQIIITTPSLSSRGGDLQSNPFHFAHESLARLHLLHNGVRNPIDSFTPDFWNEVYAREYYHLLMNSGKVYRNKGLPFSLSDYGGGYFFVMYDLTEDMCNSRHLHVGKTGNLELEMEWHDSLARGLNILVMSIFDQVVEIDPVSKMPSVSIF